MKKNSSNSTPNEYQISDSLRTLIIEYMEACNNEEYAKAEAILKQIEQSKEWKSHSI